MARDGSGGYSLPESAFVSGTTIESAKVNSNFSDIATEIANSVDKDGQTVWTGDMDAGGNRINNLLGITVETTNSSRTLYVDETNDRVGIGLSDLAPTDGLLHIRSADISKAGWAGADELVIEGTGSVGINLLSDTDAYLAFAGTSSNPAAYVRYNLSNAEIILDSGATQLSVISGTEVVVNDDGLDRDFRVESDNSTHMFFVDGGTENVHINNSASATSAVGHLHVGIGTSPTAVITDGITIGAKNTTEISPAATLELWTESAPVSIGTFTASHKLAVWINGTEYYIQLDAK